MFKTSQYNFFVPYDEKLMIAFNGVSKAMGRFTSEEFDVVKTILKAPNNPVIKLPTGMKIKKYLARNGFIIPVHLDELSFLKKRNREGIEAKNSFDLIIMPTLNCNFNCFYCYEDHRPLKMSSETQKRIMDWGLRAIPEYRLLNLSWFGGEPLLELDTIVKLSTFFRDLCQHHKTGFHNMITTNGYLLNQRVVNTLKKIGVQTFNITVDGSPRWHNKFRTHRNRTKTFDEIIKGIIRIAETLPDVRINVRVNYNSDSFDDIPELFDVFPIEIRGRLFLLFCQIFGKKADRCVLADKTDREQSLYDMAEKKGYGIDLEGSIFGPKETFCYADRESSLILNPAGEVFKCAVSNFTSNVKLGEIDKDGRIVWEQERIEQWQSIDGFDDPHCRKCRYLPLCMGGCRSQRLNGGRNKECAQTFEHIDLLLKQTYRKRGIS